MELNLSSKSSSIVYYMSDIDRTNIFVSQALKETKSSLIKGKTKAFIKNIKNAISNTAENKNKLEEIKDTKIIASIVNDEVIDIKYDVLNLKKSKAKITIDSLDELVLKYQKTGDLDAFETVYNFYKPKFDGVAYRSGNEDVTQELSIALLRAFETFKEGKHAKFNTYFWKIAHNHLGTLRIKNDAKKRTAENGIVSYNVTKTIEDSEVEYGDLIVDEKAEKKFEEVTLNTFLDHNIFPYIKAIDVKAIKYYLKGYTLEEIGRKLGGISAPAIHVKIKRLRNQEHLFKAICRYFGDCGYNMKKLLA